MVVNLAARMGGLGAYLTANPLRVKVKQAVTSQNGGCKALTVKLMNDDKADVSR